PVGPLPATGPAAGALPQVPLNSLIDPATLESLQQSIVGLVIVWNEHEDPFAWLNAPSESPDPAAPPEPPVLSICTGWFDTATTIATAGHCVDPEQGRIAMHLQRGGIDPATGLPTPIDYAQPPPVATVYAFQPRELPGAVLTSPTIVRVHNFRSAEDGDTAKLEVHGIPPAKPLPIAPTPPQLGEPVTSIGFPGVNLPETDGLNVDKLMEGEGESPAEILQNSRLHPVNTSGTIMSRQFRKGVAVYQINADFAGGLSGGPTINSRGQVYGINSQMTVAFFASPTPACCASSSDTTNHSHPHPLPTQPLPARPKAAHPTPAHLLPACPPPARARRAPRLCAATPQPRRADLPVGSLPPQASAEPLLVALPGLISDVSGAPGQPAKPPRPPIPHPT
ncbi:MAG: trypsin-like peptidase domain-containing protein, partial [Pseudonocardia sp.]